MKRTQLALPHSGRRWRALLCASAIGAMVLVSAQPAAAAGCSFTTAASRSKLVAGTKSSMTTGYKIMKIVWQAIYPNALPQPAFSTWTPLSNGAYVTALSDGNSTILYPSTAAPIYLPPVQWNTDGGINGNCLNTTASSRCGWDHNAAFTKWRWRGGPSSVHPEVKGLVLKVVHPGLPTEAVKVKVGIQRTGLVLSALASSTLPLPLDILVDPNGLGNDCVNGGFLLSQCAQIIDSVPDVEEAKVMCHNP